MPKKLFNEWKVLCHPDKNQTAIAKYASEKLKTAITPARISEYGTGNRAIPRNFIKMIVAEYYPIYCQHEYGLTHEQSANLAKKMVDDLKDDD